MKNYKSIFVIIATLVIISCTKDSDVNSLNNNFTFQEKSLLSLTPCPSAIDIRSNCISPTIINQHVEFDVSPGGLGNGFHFSWVNGSLEYECTYISRIELFNDNMTDPNTCLTYLDGNPNGNGYCSSGDVNVSIPIHFFDENTHFVYVINDFFDEVEKSFEDVDISLATSLAIFAD